jgi:hypothetical protein
VGVEAEVVAELERDRQGDEPVPVRVDLLPHPGAVRAAEPVLEEPEEVESTFAWRGLVAPLVVGPPRLSAARSALVARVEQILAPGG